MDLDNQDDHLDESNIQITLSDEGAQGIGPSHRGTNSDPSEENSDSTPRLDDDDGHDLTIEDEILVDEQSIS